MAWIDRNSCTRALVSCFVYKYPKQFPITSRQCTVKCRLKWKWSKIGINRDKNYSETWNRWRNQQRDYFSHSQKYFSSLLFMKNLITHLKFAWLLIKHDHISRRIAFRHSISLQLHMNEWGSRKKLGSKLCAKCSYLSLVETADGESPNFSNSFAKTCNKWYGTPLVNQIGSLAEYKLEKNKRFVS